MDIDKLRYFSTVVQTGSLVRASELLKISQPALSKAIKLLQEDLNLELLIPSGRGVAVTDAGQRLFKEAAPIIEKFENLPEKIRQTNVATELKLGSFEVFTTYFLGQLFSNSFKDIKIQIFELIPGDLEAAIKNRTVDIGITYLPIPDPDVEFLKATTIEMGIFGLKKFSSKSFQELPFVIPNGSVSGTPSKVKGIDGWRDDLIPRKASYRVTLMESGLEICRSGHAVGYFPKFVVELHNEKTKDEFKLHEIKFPKLAKFPSKQDVYLVKRKTDLESNLFKKLAKELRRLD